MEAAKTRKSLTKLGSIFDEIGFNQINHAVFRQLEFYRIAFPWSKLKTTEYLYRYEGSRWGEDQFYRYLDKLYYHQKSRVKRICFDHCRRILVGHIKMVLYGVTTLHFAIDCEDELSIISRASMYYKPDWYKWTDEMGVYARTENYKLYGEMAGFTIQLMMYKKNSTFH